MTHKPDKLFLVIGHHAAWDAPDFEPSHDPRQYGLPDIDPISDEDYDKEKDRFRAFDNPDDAISFCYSCGLELTICRAYRLVDGQYVRDNEMADEVLDIDW